MESSLFSDWKTLIPFLVRVVVGVTFVIAGLLKMVDLRSFVDSVEAFEIIPQGFAPGFSVLIISLEISFGLLFAVGFFTRLSSYALSGLLLIFIFAMVIEIARGNSSLCGCFGPVFRESIGSGAVVRDSLLMAGLVWSSTEREKIWSVDRMMRGSAE